MGLFTTEDNPVFFEVADKIKEQNKLNIDEYTGFTKPLTPIQNFYAGKSIFLTGATGFLGICFVEKVLRDCSDIKKLYLLVRSKNGVPIEDRMKKYFSNIVFDRLRKINPNFEEKIVTVIGDLSERTLGLSPEDRQLLIDNIDIMVHNGATVKFFEPINVALKINVLGTKAMLELALACKNMKSFVYVSTAYSHNYRKHIKEEFYEPPADLKMVHDIIVADQAAKHGLSKDVTEMIFGKWANIYTFTKSIAEDLVRQYGEKANFVCSVYRPTMVSSAHTEPRIGWVGNKSGPNTIILAAELGAMHVLYDNDEAIDLIPVDYSINALIAAVHESTKQWEIERRPRVFNLGSSMANPVTMKKLYSVGLASVSTLGIEAALWHGTVIFTFNKWLFYLLHFFLHCIPAIVVDVVLLAMRKKPRALKICIPLTQNLHWLMYFMSSGWRIQVTEMRKVYDEMSDPDRKLFNFDIWSLDWSSDYLIRWCLGTKLYLMKESLDQHNIEKGKRQIALLKVIHFTVITIFYLITGYCLMKLFGIIN